MAGKGNLFLSNDILIRLFDEIKSYETTVQDSLYDEYKNAYKISLTNHMRGKAADSFKNYITHGAINIITELMDVAADVTTIIQLLAEAFYQYEKNHSGKVEEQALDYIENSIKDKENVFDGIVPDIKQVLNLAAQYISVKSVPFDSVSSDYGDLKQKLKSIRNDLYATDDSSLTAVNELMNRISELKGLIQNTLGYCYDGDGKIIPDNLNQIQSQGWFKTAGNVALYLKKEEDPFVYSAGEVTVSEDQWAAGLCSDVYAYAGYSFLDASYEGGVENGTAFIKGAATVLAVNGYAQFTDFLKAKGEVRVGFAEGEAKAGWSDEYVGFKVDAEVGLIDAEGSVVLGSDDLNAFVKGEVKVLCADGKAAFEFEDDGEFAVGVDASATLASASVKGGTTIFSYKNKDTATGETETLLGFKAGAKADAGGSFALWAESETAIEGEYVNINATTIKIDAALLLGIDLSVTIPTPYFKWPW